MRVEGDIKDILHIKVFLTGKHSWKTSNTCFWNFQSTRYYFFLIKIKKYSKYYAIGRWILIKLLNLQLKEPIPWLTIAFLSWISQNSQINIMNIWLTLQINNSLTQSILMELNNCHQIFFKWTEKQNSHTFSVDLCTFSLAFSLYSMDNLKQLRSKINGHVICVVLGGYHKLMILDELKTNRKNVHKK